MDCTHRIVKENWTMLQKKLKLDTYVNILYRTLSQ